jgi:hypothetical protein
MGLSDTGRVGRNPSKRIGLRSLTLLTMTNNTFTGKPPTQAADGFADLPEKPRPA